MANDLLAEVITEAFKSKDQKAVIGVLEMLRVMMERDKHLIVPVEWMEDAKASLHVEAEEGVQKAVFDKDTKLAIRHINGKDNEDWLVAFSSFEELQKGASTFSAPVNGGCEGYGCEGNCNQSFRKPVPSGGNYD